MGSKRRRTEGKARNMEAMVRAIKKAAVSAEQTEKRSLAEVQKWVDEIYGDKKPKNVAEDLIAERRREARREEEEYLRK
jgi:hypothetical protein